MDPNLSKGKEIKTKMNKSDLIKLKSFCRSKEKNSRKQKREHNEQEKILAKCGQKRFNMQNIQMSHTIQYKKLNK